MKKTLFFSLVALSVLSFTSCNKFEMDDDDDDIVTTEETINATINSNESFKFVLPVNANDASITSPQAKSANAIIDNTNGNNNFVYTPDPNFSGTDVVILTTTDNKKEKGDCGNRDKKSEKNRNCAKPENNKCDKRQNENKKQHKITFNITVNSNIN
jgi:hypothetical protein